MQYSDAPPAPSPIPSGSGSSAAQTPLLQAFPKAQALSSVPPLPRSSSLNEPKLIRSLTRLDGHSARRDDLQDLLTDEPYQQAFVHTLPEVEQLLREIEAIERENEALAGTSRQNRFRREDVHLTLASPPNRAEPGPAAGT